MNWKDIPDFEGLYQVSDCGKIKSLPRVIKNGQNSSFKTKERILKPIYDKNGYFVINLHKPGEKLKNAKIHRLVMYAHSHVDYTLTIDHIDGCKTNNHISNLRYLTRGENSKEFWKKNPDHTSSSTKHNSIKVFDTHTNTEYESINQVSKMMYNTGQATGPWVWYHKIKNNKQDRFKILEKE